MFKLVAVLLMVVVVCNGFITGNVGSYSDRPELLSDQTVQDLTSYAAGAMFMGPNPFLKNLKIIRVQTQLVEGTNYKIDFTGEPFHGVSGQKTTCQVVINVRYDSVKSILQSQCQTS
jgi:hypothetical protein